MDTYTPKSFGDTVRNDYARRTTATHLFEAASKSYTGVTRATAAFAAQGLETRRMGHPDYDDLQIGEVRTADIACVFIDLTDFTGRSHWDDSAQVTTLAHAVLTGFVEVVSIYGGYPLGLRGDGLFAGFGPGVPAVAATMALSACAFALDAVAREVNPWLTRSGIEPIKARAGIDYGRIDFVRTGSYESSEVNPIGFAANFAAKCEKYANSWEIVVGSGLTHLLADTSDFTQHKHSPKTFQRQYEQHLYSFYDYNWRPVLPLLPTVARQLDGRPVGAVGIA